MGKIKYFLIILLCIFGMIACVDNDKVNVENQNKNDGESEIVNHETESKNEVNNETKSQTTRKNEEATQYIAERDDSRKSKYVEGIVYSIDNGGDPDDDDSIQFTTVRLKSEDEVDGKTIYYLYYSNYDGQPARHIYNSEPQGLIGNKCRLEYYGELTKVEDDFFNLKENEELYLITEVVCAEYE